MILNALKLRELFHLAFLKSFMRKSPPDSFAIKGGANLRFFFGSDRYSEDLDIDIEGVAIHVIKEVVMSILQSSGLKDTVRSFGIDQINQPDMGHAKQPETVQRFKIHLITIAGEDLATKIEFSRRGLDSPILSGPVLGEVLSTYCLNPLIVPHYADEAAAKQKIQALLNRRQPEARDVFDLYVLSQRPAVRLQSIQSHFTRDEISRAIDRIDSIEYLRYRDTVIGFLSDEDRKRYDCGETWDQIRFTVIELLEQKSPGKK